MIIMISITLFLLVIYLPLIFILKKKVRKSRKILKLAKEKLAIIQEIHRIYDSKLTYLKWMKQNNISVLTLDLSSFDKEEAIAEMQLMLKEEEIKNMKNGS